MRKIVLLLFLVIGMSAFSTPALAFDEKEDGCATTLLKCFEEAAKIDDFWYRWAAGIDCELDFIECARIKIWGS
jgi:hypothetical protein